MSLKTCGKCGGAGSIPQTRKIEGGGLFGWRQQCGRCEGTGFVPYDPWTVPTIVFVALIVAYFIWQLFIR